MHAIFDGSSFAGLFSVICCPYQSQASGVLENLIVMFRGREGPLRKALKFFLAQCSFDAITNVVIPAWSNWNQMNG